MEVSYAIVATLATISILNTCIATCHNKRLKYLEQRVKILEERPNVSPSVVSTATAPYLPPLANNYARPIFPIPQVGLRPTAPPQVPIYYAQDPQLPNPNDNQNYQYGARY
jgi:hypothetical protein